MEAEFADRLNLITGDNGLGKSFLLDVAWWALTRTWAGRPALPRESSKKSSIATVITGRNGRESRRDIHFDFQQQIWKQPRGRAEMPGLVIYAQVDGSFSVWDPARNYWKQEEQDRVSAYLFDSRQVWTGLQDADGKWNCNGLLRDWASWQREKSASYRQLCKALKALSPPGEELKPGELVRIHPDDSQDYPTIAMPYGIDVPVVHASAAIRRVLALAYLLIWAWEEHVRAAKLRREEPTKRIVFLIDEVEAHLHPGWQKRILPCLFEAVEQMQSQPGLNVQMIVTTHAPLVCVSLETFFNPAMDRLLDLDLDTGNNVVLSIVDFQRRGPAGNWLVSPHFGLESEYSEKAEDELRAASALVESEIAAPGSVKRATFIAQDTRLRSVLGELDPFWVRWRRIGEKKGWIS